MFIDYDSSCKHDMCHWGCSRSRFCCWKSKNRFMSSWNMAKLDYPEQLAFVAGYRSGNQWWHWKILIHRRVSHQKNMERGWSSHFWFVDSRQQSSGDGVEWSVHGWGPGCEFSNGSCTSRMWMFLACFFPRAGTWVLPYFLGDFGVCVHSRLALWLT